VWLSNVFLFCFCSFFGWGCLFSQWSSGSSGPGNQQHRFPASRRRTPTRLLGILWRGKPCCRRMRQPAGCPSRTNSRATQRQGRVPCEAAAEGGGGEERRWWVQYPEKKYFGLLSFFRTCLLKELSAWFFVQMNTCLSWEHVAKVSEDTPRFWDHATSRTQSLWCSSTASCFHSTPSSTQIFTVLSQPPVAKRFTTEVCEPLARGDSAGAQLMALQPVLCPRKTWESHWPSAFQSPKTRISECPKCSNVK